MKNYTICTTKYGDEVFAIETERLRLSVYKRSAYKKVTEYVINNREFHRKFSQPRDESYFTSRTQKEYLDGDMKAFRGGHLVPLWITVKGEPDKIIGRLSFFNIAYGDMMLAQLGYHMDEANTGNGYMTEAIKGSCQMMFDVMGMHRIEAFILPENEKSLNLIKRCGFTYEGVRHSYMNINGEYRDHENFYLLRG